MGLVSKKWRTVWHREWKWSTLDEVRNLRKGWRNKRFNYCDTLSSKYKRGTEQGNCEQMPRRGSKDPNERGRTWWSQLFQVLGDNNHFWPNCCVEFRARIGLAIAGLTRQKLIWKTNSTFPATVINLFKTLVLATVTHIRLWTRDSERRHQMKCIPLGTVEYRIHRLKDNTMCLADHQWHHVLHQLVCKE